jgi:hypothetical protein
MITFMLQEWVPMAVIDEFLLAQVIMAQKKRCQLKIYAVFLVI